MWRQGGGNEISLYLEGRSMLRKGFCVRFVSMNLVKNKCIKNFGF